MTTLNFTFYGNNSGINQVCVEFSTETGTYTRHPNNPELNTNRVYPQSSKKALILLRDAIKKHIKNMGDDLD